MNSPQKTFAGQLWCRQMSVCFLDAKLWTPLNVTMQQEGHANAACKHIKANLTLNKTPLNMDGGFSSDTPFVVMMRVTTHKNKILSSALFAFCLI